MTQEEFDDQIAALVKYNSDLSAIKSKVLDVAMLKNLKIENEVDTIDTVLDKIADKLNKTEGEIIIKSNKQIVDVANYAAARIEILGPDVYYKHNIYLTMNFTLVPNITLALQVSGTRTEKITIHTKKNMPYASLSDLYADIGSSAKISFSGEQFSILANETTGVYWLISLASLTDFVLDGTVKSASDGSDITSSYSFKPLTEEDVIIEDNCDNDFPIIVYYSGAIPKEQENPFNFTEAKVFAEFNYSTESFSFSDNLTITNDNGNFIVIEDYSGIACNVISVDENSGVLVYEIEKSYSGNTAIVTCTLNFIDLTTSATAVVSGLSAKWNGSMSIISKV